MIKVKYISLISIFFMALTPRVFAEPDTAMFEKELQSLRDKLEDLTKQLAEQKSTKSGAPKSQIVPTTENKATVTEQPKGTQNSEKKTINTPETEGSSPLENVTPNTPKTEVVPPPIHSDTPDKEKTTTNPVPTLIWKGPEITGMIAGGANAGYSWTAKENKNGSFNILDFNPLFLFMYKDTFFLRSSIDFSLDDQGDTSVGLDFLNLNIFLNDYLALGVGSFDTDLGFFGQNISPAWINKLPDSPVGFDSDQAAPQIEVGVRLQGGAPLCGTTKINYSFTISNGNRAYVDTTNLVIDHIGSDGYTKNYDNYFWGGRLGLLPIPELEIGISGSIGKLALFDLADGTNLLKKRRGYNSIGSDISYRPGNWVFRGEYTQQQVSSQRSSIVPQRQRWKAWYLQASYLIPDTKWEPVVRFSKFKAPDSSQSQRQWACGINYWFTPSIAAQASFEINKGQHGTSANHNAALIQLVFGF